MRVAYLVNQYPKTSHTFIRREIAALEASGIEVDRFTIRQVGEELIDPDDQAQRRQTRVILGVGLAGLALATLAALVTRPRRFVHAAVLAVRIGWRSDRGLPRYLAYLGEACVLRRWLAQSGARHVHAHFSTNAATVAMLAFLLGGPGYSFTCHGGDELDTFSTVGLEEKVRRARFVVAASHYVRAQVMRFARIEDWSRLHVVRCAVDDGYLARECSPVPAARRAVFVGRMCREKMPLVLVRAAGLLRREGRPIELVLVGDGDLRPAVESAVDREGLREYVRMIGWADGAEVRRQIDAARVVVLPSALEGLPVVCMEALAAGRPVVSTFVAGIPELVRPGENGWLVPPGDAEALAAALREACDASGDQLSAMGREGRRRVECFHHPRIEAARLAEFFREGIESQALTPSAS